MKNEFQYHKGKTNIMIMLPFKLCTSFLELLGRIFHLSYQQISVIFNIYIQGGVLALTGILPLIAQIYATCHQINVLNVFLLVLITAYASIYVMGLLVLLKHYPKTLVKSFDQCVNDLLMFSRWFHISYGALNLIIFVVWWLAIVGMNLFISYQIIHFVQ